MYINNNYTKLKERLKGHKFIRTRDGRYSMDDVVSLKFENIYQYERGVNEAIDWMLWQLNDLEDNEVNFISKKPDDFMQTQLKINESVRDFSKNQMIINKKLIKRINTLAKKVESLKAEVHDD